MCIWNESNENSVPKYLDYQDVAPITLPYEACSTTSITVLEDFNSLKFSKTQAA